MNEDMCKQYIICIGNHEIVFAHNTIKEMLQNCLTSHCGRPYSQFCQKYSINLQKEERKSNITKINQN